jgi:hypothetical protein
VEVMAFTGEFIELPFTSEWTVQRMVGHTDSLPFGSTDCSQPMLWAAEKKKEFGWDFALYFCNQFYFICLRRVHRDDRQRDMGRRSAAIRRPTVGSLLIY